MSRIFISPCRLHASLFGNYKRADKGAYIDIRTSFGQYEWHRLGSLVKNEVIRPLEEFGVQHYLVAPQEWMVRLDNMQRRLEAQEQHRIDGELNMQGHFPQMEAAELGQEDHNPTTQYEPDSMAAASPSYIGQSNLSESLGDLQGSSRDHESEVDELSVEPDTEVEAGPSTGPPQEVHHRKQKIKQVTVERRDNSSGYKFAWRGSRDKAKTEKGQWIRNGDVLTLREGHRGYIVWVYKP